MIVRFLVVVVFCLERVAVARDARVLVTAPPAYAERLASALSSRLESVRVTRGATIETVLFDDGSDEARELRDALLEDADFVAFTSRRGIEACFAAAPERLRRGRSRLAALGADAQLLDELGVDLDDVVRPGDASPRGLVDELSSLVPWERRRHTTVCAPVPVVEAPLEEPPVVPAFLDGLRKAGFVVRRVAAYRTRRTEASDAVLAALREPCCDVVAVTSTAEIDALVSICAEGGIDLNGAAAPDIVAHGPVTALGIHRAGLTVAECNLNYQSFDGLAETVAVVLSRRERRQRTVALASRLWFFDWLQKVLCAAPAPPPSGGG